MHYELSDYEWIAIKPMLPNKPRGVRRVSDLRVLNCSLGSPVRVRHGATWQRPILPASFRSLAAWRMGPDHGCAGCWS